MTGTLTSRLTLGDLLGQGHFGSVFLGQDPVHGEVAVKVISRVTGEDPDAWLRRKEMLLKEGQHLVKAAHRHVLSVHQVLEEAQEDAILLSMECCPGGSLQAHFEVGPLPLDRVREIATAVCLGLQALHAQGMLHRDIKPANILLDKLGVAKLGDFGLVTDELVRGYGSQMGYNDHLAPEVHQGGPTSVKTDIFALGMTVYRLLHGRAWYEAFPEPKSVIPAGGFAKGLKWLPHIPKPWRSFIRKMLNDNPHARYQSATQVLDALAKLPIDPSWTCAMGANRVEWTLVDSRRRKVVTWLRPSTRRNSWEAKSFPIVDGNSRVLRLATKPRSQSLVLSELERFLSK